MQLRCGEDPTPAFELNLWCSPVSSYKAAMPQHKMQRNSCPKWLENQGLLFFHLSHRTNMWLSTTVNKWPEQMQNSPFKGSEDQELIRIFFLALAFFLSLFFCLPREKSAE